MLGKFISTQAPDYLRKFLDTALVKTILQPNICLPHSTETSHKTIYRCHLRVNGIEGLYSVNWVRFRFLYDLLCIVEEEHTEEYETSVHCDRVHPRSQCRGRRQEHGACKRDITLNLRQTWGQDYKEKTQTQLKTKLKLNVLEHT